MSEREHTWSFDWAGEMCSQCGVRIERVQDGLESKFCTGLQSAVIAAAQALSDDSEASRGEGPEACYTCAACGWMIRDRDPAAWRAAEAHTDATGHHFFGSASPDGEAEGEAASIWKLLDDTLPMAINPEFRDAIDKANEHVCRKEDDRVRSLIREATEPLERRIDELESDAQLLRDRLAWAKAPQELKDKAAPKTITVTHSFQYPDTPPKDTLPASALKHGTIKT